MAVSQPPETNPFYIQLTNVKETYTAQSGVQQELDLPMITLPPGTVLFRGVKIPNPAAGDDPRYFYRDYLGDPEGKDSVCLNPTHNTFFYPFPYVAFGANNVGKTFQSMQAVVLVHPMTIIAAIGPSTTTRSDSAKTDGDAPWQRCDKLVDFMCHPPTQEEFERLKFDACLHPKYQQQTKVRGWMAIADLDSLRSRKEFQQARLDGKTASAGKSSMSAYLKDMEARRPGSAAEVLCWLYTDKVHKGEEDRVRRIGFPEVALYPYRNHQGPEPVKRKCRTSEDAIYYMAEEAKRNNLNYLPLAAFTKDGVTDMVNGHFSMECVVSDQSTFTIPAPEQQGSIEYRMNQWLNMVQTSGLELPFYGKGKLHFDTRTGFFVFPHMVPKVLRVPVPLESKSAAEGGKHDEIPYRFLLLPLDSEERKRRAITYMLLFRSYIPGEAMKMFGLEKEVGVRRAFVFDRPPLLKDIFEQLSIPLPDLFQDVLRRAAFQYQKNTGKKSKRQLAKDEEQTAALSVIQTPGMLGVDGPKNHNFFFYDARGTRIAAYDRKYLYTLDEKTIRELLAYAGRSEEITDGEQHLATYGRFLPAEARSKFRYLYKWTIMDRLGDEGAIDETLDNLMSDNVCLYSTTESEVADKMAKIILDALVTFVGSEDIRKTAVITDSSACIGGNALAFCDTFKFVNAVEKSPNRAIMLLHNLTTFSYDFNDFSVYCADYLTIMASLQQDVVFFDPPWGGPNYKQTNLVLRLGGLDLVEIIFDLFSNKLAKMVAIKVPESYDADAFILRLKSEAPEGMDTDVTQVPMNQYVASSNLVLLLITSKEVAMAAERAAEGGVEVVAKEYSPKIPPLGLPSAAEGEQSLYQGEYITPPEEREAALARGIAAKKAEEAARAAKRAQVVEGSKATKGVEEAPVVRGRTIKEILEAEAEKVTAVGEQVKAQEQVLEDARTRSAPDTAQIYQTLQQYKKDYENALEQGHQLTDFLMGRNRLGETMYLNPYPDRNPRQYPFYMYNRTGLQTEQYSLQDIENATRQELEEVLREQGRAGEAASEAQINPVTGDAIPEAWLSDMVRVFKQLYAESESIIRPKDRKGYKGFLVEESCLKEAKSTNHARILSNTLKRLKTERSYSATLVNSCLGHDAAHFYRMFPTTNVVQQSIQRGIMVLHNFSYLFGERKDGFIVHCAPYALIQKQLQQDVLYFTKPFETLDESLLDTAYIVAFYVDPAFDMTPLLERFPEGGDIVVMKEDTLLLFYKQSYVDAKKAASNGKILAQQRAAAKRFLQQAQYGTPTDEEIDAEVEAEKKRDVKYHVNRPAAPLLPAIENIEQEQKDFDRRRAAAFEYFKRVYGRNPIGNELTEEMGREEGRLVKLHEGPVTLTEEQIAELGEPYQKEKREEGQRILTAKMLLRRQQKSAVKVVDPDARYGRSETGTPYFGPEKITILYKLKDLPSVRDAIASGDEDLYEAELEKADPETQKFFNKVKVGYSFQELMDMLKESTGGRRVTRSKRKGSKAKISKTNTRRRTTPKSRHVSQTQHAIAKKFSSVWSAFAKTIQS